VKRIFRIFWPQTVSNEKNRKKKTIIRLIKDGKWHALRKDPQVAERQVLYWVDVRGEDLTGHCGKDLKRSWGLAPKEDTLEMLRGSPESPKERNPILTAEELVFDSL
jgi:hypothetical protein